MLLVVLLTIGACAKSNDVSGDEAAIAVCKARREYRKSTLRAAYDTTVGEVAAWMDAKNPPNWGHVGLPYEQDHEPAAPMSLCWLDDGGLAFPGPAQVSGRPRAAVLIDAAGKASFLVGGYFDKKSGRSELAIEDPAPSGTPTGSTAAVAPKRGPAGELRLPAYAKTRKLSGTGWDRLGISGDDDAGCVWITFTDGFRYAALWPKGSTARFAPLRISNAAGDVLWREGESRAVTGELSKADARSVPTACRSGDWTLKVGTIGNLVGESVEHSRSSGGRFSPRV